MADTIDTIEILHSYIDGNRPPTPGVEGNPYVNFAENQYGVIDNVGNHDLLAVRIFSILSSYQVGNMVTYNGQQYRAIVAIQPGAFDPGEWDQIPTFSQLPGTNFSPTLSYLAGAIVSYNGQLYQALANVPAGTFNPAQWNQYITTSDITNPPAGSPITNVLASYNKSRNRLTNGSFIIDNINWGIPQNWGANDNRYLCDRWQAWVSNGGQFKSCASVIPGTVTNFSAGLLIPPYEGISTCLIIQSTASYSIPLSNYQSGFGVTVAYWNILDFVWGTSQAQPITLSFMAYASIAGTYSGSVGDYSGERVYIFSYTLQANTWTKIVITIPGDTNSYWLGTSNNSAISIFIYFDLASSNDFRGTPNSGWISNNGFNAAATGSVNLLATNNAIFALTNVQLEEGSIATPFEYKLNEDVLSECYQYYQTNYPVGVFPGTNMEPYMENAVQYGGNGANPTLWWGWFPWTLPFILTPTVSIWSSDGVAGATSSDIGDQALSIAPTFQCMQYSPTQSCGWGAFYYVALAEVAN